jgi:hypothetical protein
VEDTFRARTPFRATDLVVLRVVPSSCLGTLDGATNNGLRQLLPSCFKNMLPFRDFAGSLCSLGRRMYRFCVSLAAMAIVQVRLPNHRAWHARPAAPAADTNLLLSLLLLLLIYILL